jgi:hypothetical protein
MGEKKNLSASQKDEFTILERLDGFKVVSVGRVMKVKQGAQTSFREDVWLLTLLSR